MKTYFFTFFQNLKISLSFKENFPSSAELGYFVSCGAYIAIHCSQFGTLNACGTIKFFQTGRSASRSSKKVSWDGTFVAKNLLQTGRSAPKLFLRNGTFDAKNPLQTRRSAPKNTQTGPLASRAKNFLETKHSAPKNSLQMGCFAFRGACGTKHFSQNRTFGAFGAENPLQTGCFASAENRQFGGKNQ